MQNDKQALLKEYEKYAYPDDGRPFILTFKEWLHFSGNAKAQQPA